MNRSNYKKMVGIAFLLLALSLLLISCLPGTIITKQAAPAGFFLGIWHGWVAPISLIVGIFDPSIRIYETVNTGWLYDFGFYIAIISGFGGLSLARRRSARNHRR